MGQDGKRSLLADVAPQVYGCDIRGGCGPALQAVGMLLVRNREPCVASLLQSAPQERFRSTPNTLLLSPAEQFASYVSVRGTAPKVSTAGALLLERLKVGGGS